MISRLARRLGFQASVPVAAVDDWVMPRSDHAEPLAPRDAQATCLVDGVGRVQPAHYRWTLDWTLNAGARWVSAIESERVSQRQVAPAVIETTIESPAGPVVQRVVAAVVGGQPAAIIEIENQGGVAIAVGIVARPLVHGGRGYLRCAEVRSDAIELGDQGAIRFEYAAATLTADGVDLLQAMPAPDAGANGDRVESRAGAVQAAAVFPLPHTATLRMVVELGEPIRIDAAVPSVEDVQRGWGHHLEAGARYSVGETDLDERTAVATRGLLTSWPAQGDVPRTIRALAEAGHGHDAPRLFADLETLDDDPGITAAIARWAQLGEATSQLDDLDRIIGPLARAIHGVVGARLVGGAWTSSAFAALAERLDLIDQPDVAERVRSLTGSDGSDIEFASLMKRSTSLADLANPARATQLHTGVRMALLADRRDGIDLLPALPEGWRGRTVDVFNAPISAGARSLGWVSFGVRWHGPRPALLWEVDRPDEVATESFEVTASAIDPTFRSNEPVGETLLADPGWPRKG